MTIMRYESVYFLQALKSAVVSKNWQILSMGDGGGDDCDGLHIYFSYLDGFEKDNLVVHLVHLLLVSLHKAVAKLDSHPGRLLYNWVALQVGGKTDLRRDPRHLPHLWQCGRWL